MEYFDVVGGGEAGVWGHAPVWGAGMARPLRLESYEALLGELCEGEGGRQRPKLVAACYKSRLDPESLAGL